MKLETFLSATEMRQFEDLLALASPADAQAVRYYSEASSLVILGICQGGELLTWFASPAKGPEEIAVVQAVVLAGIAEAGAVFARLQSGVDNLAASAIGKASIKD